MSKTQPPQPPRSSQPSRGSEYQRFRIAGSDDAEDDVHRDSLLNVVVHPTALGLPVRRASDGSPRAALPRAKGLYPAGSKPSARRTITSRLAILTLIGLVMAGAYVGYRRLLEPALNNSSTPQVETEVPVLTSLDAGPVGLPSEDVRRAQSFQLRPSDSIAGSTAEGLATVQPGPVIQAAPVAPVVSRATSAAADVVGARAAVEDFRRALLARNVDAEAIWNRGRIPVHLESSAIGSPLLMFDRCEYRLAKAPASVTCFVPSATGRGTAETASASVDRVWEFFVAPDLRTWHVTSIAVR